MEPHDNLHLFENLLQQTKHTVLEYLRSVGDASKVTPTDFERIVAEHVKQNAIGTVFEGAFEQTKDREFPDIVDNNYFGIEVKATEKDAWTSIGNSVLESSRNSTVKKIYMFFGKLGGEPDIAFREYDKVLKGIAVTHYPRYQINMNLEDGEAIFDKMNVPYEEIRNSDDRVKKIKAYYRSQMKDGDSLWWIDDEVAVSGPILRNLSSLNSEERDAILVGVFVNFPEVLGNSNKKYESVPGFLVTNYNVVTANLRDFFTAGGVVTIRYQGNEITVPQIVFNVFRLAKDIASQLESKEDWKQQVNGLTAYMELPVTFGDLFEAACVGGVELP